MENVQKAIARQNKVKQNAEVFESPTINTVDDIKRILVQLDPSIKKNQIDDNIQVLTDLTGSDGNQSTNFQVHTTTSSKSHRQILLEGFQTIKQRVEIVDKLANEEVVYSIKVNDRLMVSPPVINTEAKHTIDSIIDRLLGGYRDGQFVCWDLSDGYTYCYEIFQHRLIRIRQNAKDADPTTGSI